MLDERRLLENTTARTGITGYSPLTGLDSCRNAWAVSAHICRTAGGARDDVYAACSRFSLALP